MHKYKKMVIIALLIIILSIGIGIGIGIYKFNLTGAKAIAKEELVPENFVKNHLYEANGLLKTDLLKQKNVYLSESIGLWMIYLVEKHDQQEFDKQLEVLKTHFMKDSTLIPWRIVGDEQASTNALIDDLRIMDALFKAGERWDSANYTDLAKKMANEVNQYNTLNEVFINHVDIPNKYKGNYLTLSYLIPTTLEYMLENEIITNSQYEKNKKILINAPLSDTGFFPKTYYVLEDRYEYDEDVNLIDQYYVGYHRALWGGDVSSLIKFTEEALLEYDGKLYGRFSNKTKLPTVDYEGTSVYALAILMCIEVEEYDLAVKLYDRMNDFLITDEKNQYYGGYIDLPTLDTHTFDNLLPLIAERRGKDEGIF